MGKGLVGGQHSHHSSSQLLLGCRGGGRSEYACILFPLSHHDTSTSELIQEGSTVKPVPADIFSSNLFAQQLMHPPNT